MGRGREGGKGPRDPAARTLRKYVPGGTSAGGPPTPARAARAYNPPFSYLVSFAAPRTSGVPQLNLHGRRQTIARDGNRVTGLSFMALLAASDDPFRLRWIRNSTVGCVRDVGNESRFGRDGSAFDNQWQGEATRDWVRERGEARCSRNRKQPRCPAIRIYCGRL
jgi:hypothetical protein